MSRRFKFGPDSIGDEVVKRSHKLTLKLYRGGPDDKPMIEFELVGTLTDDDDDGDLLPAGTVEDPLQVALDLLDAMKGGS